MKKVGKVIGLLLSMAMIFTSLPLNALASELPIVLEESTEDIVEDEAFGEISLTDTEEVLTEEETFEEELQISVETEDADEIISDELSETEITALTGEVECEDYEADSVYAIVDTREEAEEIADFYGIILESYDCRVASYKLPKDVSVAEIVQKSIDNKEGYPVLCANHYGSVCDESVIENINIGDVSASSGDEFIEEEYGDDDMDLSSYMSDTPELKGEGYLNENKKDPYSRYVYQWQHDVIGSTYAWTSGIKGKGINVAILSTGIFKENDDTYDGCLKPADGSRTKIIGQYYAPTGSESERDCWAGAGIANGVLLSEIIGEEIGDAYATSDGVGVAPECSLLNIKITEGDKTEVTEENLIKAINYATDSEKHAPIDIMVIDARFNYPMSAYYNNSGMMLSIEKVLTFAHSQGIAVFAPSAASSDQSESWPAAYPYVIEVTATDKNNQHLQGTGYSSNTDLAAPGDYVTTGRCISSGSSLASTGIAAGEAALILSQKSSIKALQDADGNPLTGGELADALEKYMKASTIPAGKECGAGIVYLPKALSLGTITTTPTAPTIKTYGEHFYGGTELNYQFEIEDNYYGIKVYYTTNGKNPVYKNGSIDAYSKEYPLGTHTPIEEPVDISQKDFVIKAIAVDEKHGLVSPVVTKTIPLDYIYNLVVTAPTNKLVRGKSLKCTATVVPNNKYTSGVTWHVGWVNPLDPTDIREQLAKDNKVTVNSSGTVSAGKMEVNLIQQNYKVWAQSKKDSSKIGQWYFTVDYVSPYKSLSVDKTDRTRTAIFPETSPIPMTEWNTDKNLLMNVLTKDINGIESQAYNEPEDFIVTSSNPDVVSVTRGRDSNGKKQWFREIKGPGKATITITDTMCQGLKTTYTINVVRFATGVNLNGGSYVVAGKTLTLTASPIPTNTSISNVKWELYDEDKNLITNDKRIKISNGKIITTKDAPAGTYYVMARATNLESRIVAWKGGDLDNAWVINVAPADKLVKKLEVDSEYKNCTIFTDKNAFNSATEKTVYLKITGGGRDNQLKPYPAHFEITSSNTAIVTTTSATVYDRDYLIFTLKAKGPAGKATITVKALDGSNAKVSFTVNAVNPVSAIRIAPSKAGTQMAVLKGKSIKLKPVIVEEYGKVSNKNVTWSLKNPTDERYVTINSKTGEIKAKTDARSTFSDPYRKITVKATAADGSGAVCESDVRLYTDYGKMQFCDASASPVDSAGKAVKGSGTIHNNYGQARGVFSDIDFYVRIKPKYTSIDRWDDFITVSSSNPSLAVVNKVEKVYVEYYPTGSPENLYYVYHFKGRCVTGTGDNKTGTVKFTITGADGSQKLTYTLKVTK